MRDALLAIDRPALPGRRGKAGISSYLSSVLEGSGKPLRPEDRRELRPDASHEELGVKRIVSERQWQISSICLSGIHGSEPNCMTRLVFEHDQPHIRSPFATAAPTSRLRRAGLRKTRTILENGVSGHGLLRFVDLDPSGLILSWGLRDWLGAYRHAVFITAPSMTTPAVTYFQSATSSFRASATIVVLRRRPPLRFTRSWNQRASAESG